MQRDTKEHAAVLKSLLTDVRVLRERAESAKHCIMSSGGLDERLAKVEKHCAWFWVWYLHVKRLSGHDQESPTYRAKFTEEQLAFVDKPYASMFISTVLLPPEQKKGEESNAFKRYKLGL